MSYKVYVINLKRRNDKRLFMENQLEKFNIAYQIIEAIDCKDLSIEKIKNEGMDIIEHNFEMDHRSPNRNFTVGEI